MKTIRGEHVPFQSFMTSHLGPEGLTEEMIKKSLAKVRRLRSECFIDLLKRSGRLSKSLLGRPNKFFRRLLDQKQTTNRSLRLESLVGQTGCAAGKIKQ